MELERSRTLLRASIGLSIKPNAQDDRASSTAVLEVLRVVLSMLPLSLQSTLEVSISGRGGSSRSHTGSDSPHCCLVHFVAAAGNSASDASELSPAREQSIVTVGAVDSNNKMASFSSFGPILDVFALGVNVRAAYIGGPQATRSLSGTSMSSPAVAGTLALELAKYGKASPEELQNSLKGNATAVVTGQPQGTT
jgi:subtilisin family serine protease